ncbi:DUF3369 domain-containing protein [Cytobacillus sp. FJAT-54145]|uniref:DUF3369 domain-containing protein n=1 Tax=Cytobacillus spartinae TaxID=3299023 RepID=A0ABW6K6N3_9BACI
MVLNDVTFDGKGLSFVHAYSAKEAKRLLTEHGDIAVVLLDVVMETDDAGLQVVEYIRKSLKNPIMRIILRTGQPGQAPEKQVIVDYDINDYKEKTELTSQKLFTTLVTSLRSYRDLSIIENSKKGLEDIIVASSTILKIQSLRKFASGVLTQLTSILGLEGNALHCHGLALTKENESIQILAGIGEFANHEKMDVVSEEILNKIRTSFYEKSSLFEDDSFFIYFQSQFGSEYVIYFKGKNKLSEWDRYLIEIYGANVSIAFENLYLNKEVELSQREVIFTLGEIAETRSKETGYHVKRVAEYSKLLAMISGIPEEEAEMIRLASPMHDVGKIAISDDFLNKPGKLTYEEYEVMKTHAVIGYDMLKHSKRSIMKTAAIIALQHHEKYNGLGYPHGLKGEEIHIYGRITAIADVFDALGSDRVYKKAWEMERILTLFKEERGEHFDPHLVDLFLKHIDQFIAIKETYQDEKVF